VKKGQKKFGPLWLVVLLVVIVVPAGWFLVVRYEGEKPVVELEMPSDHIGRSYDLALSVSDSRSGLRKVWVGVNQGGQEHVLYERSFPAAGFLQGGSTRREVVEIAVKPDQLGLQEGEALLRIAIWDYSWRGWWDGNKTYLEKSVTIDTKPPQLEVLSRAHNVNPGGVGLTVYRLSEKCPQSGVSVAKTLYPGYSGLFKDPQIYLSLWAVAHDQQEAPEIKLIAVDEAGNEAQSGFYFHLRHKKFKNDTIRISDNFLKQILPKFSQELAAWQTLPAVDQFLKINRDLRQANYLKIKDMTAHRTAGIEWTGAFLRLPNSANRAGFADRRVYLYEGREIDRQVHLGIDLASTAHAPVPAANQGQVIFAGPLGIYGNTIIIDHGLGLFSMYSHLSRMDVQQGANPAKGDIIGLTGSTGLAGGDHLHFSILVNGTFVNPLEWWDPAWIKNNIISKLDEVPSVSSRE